MCKEIKPIILPLILWSLMACTPSSKKEETYDSNHPSSTEGLHPNHSPSGPVLEGGGWTGGGGSGFYCLDKDNHEEIIGVSVLDFAEFPRPENSRQFESHSDHTDFLLKGLKRLNPKFARQLEFALEKTDPALWIPKNRLELFDDIGDSAMDLEERNKNSDQNCFPMQFAVQFINDRSVDQHSWPEVYIYKSTEAESLLKELDQNRRFQSQVDENGFERQWAYLHLHEALYYLVRTYQPEVDNSYNIRHLTAYLFYVPFVDFFANEDPFWVESFNYSLEVLTGGIENWNRPTPEKSSEVR